MKRPISHPRERGSLLIVAMILCAIIGISLASYIQLGRTTLNISNRALYNSAAMNLAENGLEEAMYSINKKVADATYSWPDWTNDGTNAWKEFPAPSAFEQGATGAVRVYVANYLGTTPTAIARGRVTMGGGSGKTIDKWVQIQLRKTSKFANGLVAKESVTFKGNNASVDSWNSDPDNDNSAVTAAIPYSTAVGVRHALGTVGSISVSVDAVLIQNADIWGFAATGGVAPTVGPNGLVGPFGTAAGTIAPGHTSTDFTANFDPITTFPPAGATIAGGIHGPLNLPRIGDTTVMVPDHQGVLQPTYCYTTSDITFNNDTLNIRKLVSTDPQPNVIITLTNTLDSVRIGGGSGEIVIASGASLQLYAPGDVTIAGNGVLNGGTSTNTANQPINFQIWGTKTSGVQDIEVKGNGVYSGIIYAPNGSITVNGNGDVMGSVVANDITLVGDAKFHYDESLANFGGNNPFRVSVWKELTSAADRNVHAAVINWSL